MAEVTGLRNSALPYPVYAAPFGLVIPLLDADGDLVTGAAGLDSEVSKNGDTFADCTNEATEIGATGMYYLLLTASEMTADVVTVIVKTSTSGGKTTPIVLFPRKLVALRSGTSAAGAAGTITLDSGALAIDDVYNGCLIVATLDGAIEARVITDYVGSTKVASVTPNWNTVPDSDDTFVIYLPEGMQIPQANLAAYGGVAGTFAGGRPEVNTTHNAGTAMTAAAGVQEVKVASIANNAIAAAAIAADAITAAKIADGAIDAATFAAGAINAAAIAADAITAAKIAPDAIGASELAADAVAEIQSGLSTYAGGDTSGTTTLLSRLTATRAGFLDNLSAGATALEASVQSVLSKLLKYVQLIVRKDAAIGTDNATEKTAINADGGSGAGAFNQATDALEALRDRGDAAWADSGTPPTAAAIASQVRTELGVELGRVDVAVSTRATPAQVATELGTYDGPTHAELTAELAAADDAVLAAIAGLNNLSQANVRTAVGLASANLDTQLAALPTAGEVADRVWEEDISDHSGTVGSTAEQLAAAGASGDPWATALPGAYSAGQAGKIVGDNLNAAVGSRASQVAVDDLPTNAELATALAGADDAILAALAALNNLSQANVRTALGMGSANLDTQLDALLTNAELTAALAVADDAILAAIAALNNLSQANVRSAVGLASANLDTQLDALPTNAELTAALAAADDAVLAAIAALNNLSPAQVKTQVVAALATDTYAEPASVPAATATLADKIGILTALARNVSDLNKDTGQMRLRNDADSGNIGTRTDTDDGTVYRKGELA